MSERLRSLGVGAVVLVAVAFGVSAVAQFIPQAALEEPQRTLSLPAHRLRIEVLNAGGRAGMARGATEGLRELGFDVVDYGNASSFDLDSSVVVDRVGRLEDAAAVAGALGIRRVYSEPDANLLVDVTVRLGEDWHPGRLVGQPDESESQSDGGGPS